MSRLLEYTRFVKCFLEAWRVGSCARWNVLIEYRAGICMLSVDFRLIEKCSKICSRTACSHCSIFDMIIIIWIRVKYKLGFFFQHHLIHWYIFMAILIPSQALAWVEKKWPHILHSPDSRFFFFRDVEAYHLIIDIISVNSYIINHNHNYFVLFQKKGQYHSSR